MRARDEEVVKVLDRRVNKEEKTFFWRGCGRLLRVGGLVAAAAKRLTPTRNQPRAGSGCSRCCSSSSLLPAGRDPR